MRAARDEGDISSRLGQRRPEPAADAAGADNRDTHGFFPTHSMSGDALAEDWAGSKVSGRCRTRFRSDQHKQPLKAKRLCLLRRTSLRRSGEFSAVAFAATGINPANREVAARTTGASRSRRCWDRCRCHAGSARRSSRARGAPRCGGATRAASRRSSPGSRASARGALAGQLGTGAAGSCLADARGVACCAAIRSRSVGAVIGCWRCCKSVDMIASLFSALPPKKNIVVISVSYLDFCRTVTAPAIAAPVIRRHTCQHVSGIFC